MKTSLYFAQAYGEGNYGTGSYSCTTQQEQQGICTVGTSGGNSNNGSGGLADTGIAIVGIVTLACLLVFVALIVRVWRRPKLTTATESATPQSTKPTEL
ncbi:MAG TPA: hypothetical protein VD735_03960 [Candidatus Saccharimonadales bacterium]|nr:hypothetical protein [Candidatus Saccharimonadales bacterium]